MTTTKLIQYAPTRWVKSTNTAAHLLAFNWLDLPVWRQSSVNTVWCLIGCVIGDFAMILWFQTYSPDTSVLVVMLLAMVSGIVTSIALETLVLARQLPIKIAFRTALGMSLVGMLAMEAAMNVVDVLLAGGAQLMWSAILPMLVAGFLTPLPYNYWRLKMHGSACHGAIKPQGIGRVRPPTS